MGGISLLVIRNAILETFKKTATNKFKISLIEELKHSHPDQCQILSAEQLALLVDYGIRKAKFYSITDQHGVSKLITLMLLFGINFDTDPRFPWVRKVLSPKKFRHAVFRISDAYETGINLAKLKPKLLTQHSDINKLEDANL